MADLIFYTNPQSRGRIVRQLLIETLIIAVPGGIAGLALALSSTAIAMQTSASTSSALEAAPAASGNEPTRFCEPRLESTVRASPPAWCAASKSAEPRLATVAISVSRSK